MRRCGITVDVLRRRGVIARQAVGLRSARGNPVTKIGISIFARSLFISRVRAMGTCTYRPGEYALLEVMRLLAVNRGIFCKSRSRKNWRSLGGERRWSKLWGRLDHRLFNVAFVAFIGHSARLRRRPMNIIWCTNRLVRCTEVSIESRKRALGEARSME